MKLSSDININFGCAREAKQRMEGKRKWISLVQNRLNFLQGTKHLPSELDPLDTRAKAELGMGIALKFMSNKLQRRLDKTEPMPTDPKILDFASSFKNWGSR